MDTLDGIEKLAKQAQNQKTPAFNVSNQVMNRIRCESTCTFSMAVFDFFAGISVATASIFAYIGINTWLYITNPITQLFAPLQGILLW